MPTFDYTFTINAPLAAVSAFHHDTSVLKTLTPPPLFVQIHNFEPLGEGSVANFTIWFGPFPLHYSVVHTNVDENGFTDTQVRGPLENWQHTHCFTAVNDEVTQVSEHVEYEYKKGIRGLANRLLFSKPALTMLFTARKLITRNQIRKTRLKEQVA